MLRSCWGASLLILVAMLCAGCGGTYDKRLQSTVAKLRAGGGAVAGVGAAAGAGGAVAGVFASPIAVKGYDTKDIGLSLQLPASFFKDNQPTFMAMAYDALTGNDLKLTNRPDVLMVYSSREDALGRLVYFMALPNARTIDDYQATYTNSLTAAGATPTAWTDAGNGWKTMSGTLPPRIPGELAEHWKLFIIPQGNRFLMVMWKGYGDATQNFMSAADASMQTAQVGVPAP